MTGLGRSSHQKHVEWKRIKDCSRPMLIAMLLVLLTRWAKITGRVRIYHYIIVIVIYVIVFCYYLFFCEEFSA